MKTTLVFLFLMVMLMSCGGGNEGASTDTTTGDEPTTTTATGTEENTTGEPATTTTSNSKITAEVVQKVCGCLSSSKNESGGMDVEKMRACMGGNSTEFVANLLGPDASDKEKSDAQKELQEKTANCPQ